MNQFTRLIEKVNSLTFYVFSKSMKLTYEIVNDAFLEAVGSNSVSEVQGKSDYDFWDNDIADYVRKSDMLVQKGISVINARETRWIKNSPRILSINKIPLFDNNNAVIGILGIHYEINQEIMSLNSFDLLNVNALNKQSLCRLVNEKFNFKLKNKEIDCLALWVNGHSIKESADCLFLSHKTIEAYRANIKDKLGIRHRCELIDLTQSNGTFHFLFPITKYIISNRRSRKYRLQG